MAVTPCAGRRIVKPVDVGQQHQQIGAHHGGDARREAVVVAVADFARRNRVVLVDHRHRAPFEQARDGRARVEIALAFFGVAERDQNLPGADAMAAQRFRPGARQFDLPDGRRGLAVVELEHALRQFEDRAAERDRARRHDQHIALFRVQLRDVGDERGKPRFLDAAGFRVDQQRRTDLDDDAAEVRNGGRFWS